MTEKTEVKVKSLVEALNLFQPAKVRLTHTLKASMQTWMR